MGNRWYQFAVLPHKINYLYFMTAWDTVVKSYKDGKKMSAFSVLILFIDCLDQFDRHSGYTYALLNPMRSSRDI